MRIGVLSSSFDPVNFGHLVVADISLMRADLNTILFTPTNALRYERNIAHDKHRLKMIQLALKGREEIFEIEKSELQIQRGFHHPFYTMEYLREKYENAQLFYIINSSKISELKDYVRAEEFIQRNNFIVFCRTDVNIIKEITDIPILRKYLTTNFSFISEGTVLNTSSEYIRQRFSDLDPPYFMLPEKCIDYIEKHKLYRKGTRIETYSDITDDDYDYRDLVAADIETVDSND